MRDFVPTENPKWKSARHTILASFDLSNFKSSRANFKISLWNPQTNGVRFLKTITFNLASGLSSRDIERLAQIRNRSIGRPVSVRCKGLDICLDYLQAYLESCFLEQQVCFRAASILEIGGGYGRTCHALLSLHPGIERYVIVDVDWMADIASLYLREVLDDDLYSKVEFVTLDRFPDLKGGRFTLCLNVDGFNEFSEEVVGGYLRFIDEQGIWFYTKNPVAKYRDPQLDASTDQSAVQEAISSGILRDVIDIFDDKAIEGCVGKFLNGFRPGPTWSCVIHAPAVPWSFYHQALFRDAYKTNVLDSVELPIG